MNTPIQMFYLTYGKRILIKTLPSAQEVRDAHGQIEIGAFLVERNHQDSTYPWQVMGPADPDGSREGLDEFRQLREAVRDAKARAKRLAAIVNFPKKGTPPANSTPQAIALRVAAMAFSGHATKPMTPARRKLEEVYPEDVRGMRLNRELLAAALAYAAEVSK